MRSLLLALPLLGGCHAIAGLDELVPGGHSAGASDVEWLRVFGDANNQRITALGVDKNGSIVVAGDFHGAIDFGGEKLLADDDDVFVAKLAPDGRRLWSRRSGGSFRVEVNGLALSANGSVIIAGSFDPRLVIGDFVLDGGTGADAFVAELDLNGNPRWARQLGGNGHQVARGVAVDANGNVVVAGDFDQELVIKDGGKTDAKLAGVGQMFLAKFRGTGEYLWSSGYGDDQPQRAAVVAAAGSDQMVFAGTLNGGAMLADHPLASHGGADLFLAKLDGGGGHLWSGALGDAQSNCHEWCEVALAIDADGRVLMTGAFTGAIDFGGTKLVAALDADVFLAAFDGFGEAGKPRNLWATRFGDIAPQRPYGLAVVGRSEPVVSGGFRGSIDLGAATYQNDDYAHDVFVVGYRSDGTVAWSRQWPITSAVPDRAEPGGPRVASGPDRSVVVAGSFHGALRVGDVAFSATGGGADYDAFIVKLAPRP